MEKKYKFLSIKCDDTQQSFAAASLLGQSNIDGLSADSGKATQYDMLIHLEIIEKLYSNHYVSISFYLISVLRPLGKSYQFLSIFEIYYKRWPNSCAKLLKTVRYEY